MGKLIKNMVAIDLEMNKPYGEIIQLGACWGDVTTGEVINTASWYVATPYVIDPYITDLTGITNADTTGAYSLPIVMDAYIMENKRVEEAHGEVFMNPLTWGGGDQQLIASQLPPSWYDTRKWPFGRRWIDVKTVFVSMRIAQGQPIQGGLAKSMTKVGLSFIGRKHNAEADAYNTFVNYVALLKKFKGGV